MTIMRVAYDATRVPPQVLLAELWHVVVNGSSLPLLVLGAVVGVMCGLINVRAV